MIGVRLFGSVSRIAHILVFLAVYMMAPGLSELAEAGTHLVTHGDSAHSPDPGHEESGTTDEHGCSGAFHLCTCCHASIAFAHESEAPEPQRLGQTADCPCSVRVIDSGVIGSVFRPPIV